MRDEVVRLAESLDAALDRHEDPAVICQALRTTGVRPKDVFAAMLNAWRIFSADFIRGCSEGDCRLVTELSEDAPEVIRGNYLQQIRGLRRIAERRRASLMRGRVNISLAAPFSDRARHEVHDLFSRKNTIEGYAESLASLPNLDANDIASTIWAGRIYQVDFFRAAPHRLKLKMLELLPSVDACIAQPFVAQLLGDCALPRRYRVLAWTEGVLRPHGALQRANERIKRAFASSWEARCDEEIAHPKRNRDLFWCDQGIQTLNWLDVYSGGDNPARFDMERTLHGFELSWQIVNWLASHSAQNILSYYIDECAEELEEVMQLSDFAAYLCGNGQCSCVIPLLERIENRSPGVLARYMDANGAGLLEHLLYRNDERSPKSGSWIAMCFGRKSEIWSLEKYLLSVGCQPDAPNSVGITWADVKDAAVERFDGSVFREVSSEDRDDSEFKAGLDDLFKATAPYMDGACDVEDYLLNDQQD